MYLKELEIFGFKSFPEKTALKFEAGITVAVGPNGCGKSNILDSIKWALGEQSPKSLRGSKMEDIIFNGTESHPPLNYAEVTLSFSNEDKYLPIDYREVAVTRRLYRSGESEYLINKNPVRLKDVQDLFMGTGIGESTYSFVEQGKIEIFLGYKPEEKRLIFDEASGIVKYKERKRETLRRLEETEENLLRLEDIISEVKRQIRYLERQVEKARKYKEIEEKLLETERKIATFQISDLEAKTNRFLEELNVLKQEEEKKVSQLGELRKQAENYNQKLKELRIALDETNAEIISLTAKIESANSHINILAQRANELEERNKNIENAKNNFKERLTLQEKRIQGERVGLDNFKTEADKIGIAIEDLKNKKHNLSDQIEEAKKNIAGEKIKILELEGSRVNTQNDFVGIKTNITALTKRKQRLLLDKGRLQGVFEESKEKLEALSKELEESEKELSGLKAAKNQLFLQEEDLRAKKEDLNKMLIGREKELAELKSTYEFLKDLHIKYETFSLKKRITIIFEEEPKEFNKLVVSLKNAEFKKEGNVYKVQLDAKVVTLTEEQLDEKMKIKEEEIKKNQMEINNIEAQIKESGQKLKVEGSHIEEAQTMVNEKLQEKETLNREWNRLNEEFQLLGWETDSTSKEISGLEIKQKDAENALAFHEESLNKVKSSFDRNQEVVSCGLSEINNLEIETAKKEEQRTSLDKEKDALVSKIEILEEEKGNLLRNLEALAKERGENNARFLSFAEEAEKLKLKIGEDQNRIAQYLEEKTKYEEEESSGGEELTKVNEEAKVLSDGVEKIRSGLYNKKLEVQGVEYEKEKIKDYLRQVYRVEFEPLSMEGEENLDYFCQERDKLKDKRESLGEVNLIAIEEFEELKKREDFLNKQKEDLITSKENLKKAIQKINRISKEMFIDTFSKIEVEFKKNFRFLFAGGRAQLILLDPENVLESGVEIEVQPPGKKLQNVSLLSGGEKALTAIALIFAIFKIKPSPLCVLDEIDAPLDEANVDRFNQILKEFSATSQYIVITHNKKTMANADVLYGVTMQEKGVSKLVSVKFASEEEPISPIV